MRNAWHERGKNNSSAAFFVRLWPIRNRKLNTDFISSQTLELGPRAVQTAWQFLSDLQSFIF